MNDETPHGMFRMREISAEEVELLPEGSLTREDTAEFQAWLERTLQGAHRIIALNFQAVSTVSSSAIGKILHFKKQCDEMGRQLVIRKCNPAMLQLLKMIRFDSLIQIEQ
jgi:anti-anti-sigma factor